MTDRGIRIEGERVAVSPIRRFFRVFGSIFSGRDNSSVGTNLGVAYEQRRAMLPALSQFGLNKPSWLPYDPAVYSKEGYEKLALVFRCVTYTANAVASATLRVYDDSQAGAGLEVPDHEFRQLMKRPNEIMGESRWVAFVSMVMAVAGFCVVEKERDNFGDIVNLWPLRSDWLKPILRADSPPDWEYKIPHTRNPEILRAENVMVFRYADRPNGSPYGMGPMEALLREIGLLHKMTDFLKGFFDSGAMPVYGIIPDLAPGTTIDQKYADEVRAMWVRRHGGLQNGLEPAVLAGIKDVKRLSFDFDELALTDLRDISDLAICQAFGIHPSMVATRIGLEHSDSRANAAEARKGFYEDTVSALWVQIDDVMSIDLLPEIDDNPDLSLRFDTSRVPALQEDRNKKAIWVVRAALGGAMTVHSMHRELGIPVPKGDDYYLRPTNKVPVLASTPLESTVVEQPSGENLRALPSGIEQLFREEVES